jgi:DNA-binding response OmpR family regulator
VQASAANHDEHRRSDAFSFDDTQDSGSVIDRCVSSWGCIEHSGGTVSSKRILVVDDTEDVVKVVKMYLEHHDYEVITTNDGQEGLEKAKSEKPDLIVLDLMLPRMNGYKVCGLLKRDTRYAKIPIILFTAKTQEKDMKLGQEVGADAYITKPFEPEVLLSKIEELIKEPHKQ